MNQEQLILKHLRRFKYISSFKAIELYGITRLSARIYNLRQDGYDIRTKFSYATNRYGNLVRYADYYLVKNKDK